MPARFSAMRSSFLHAVCRAAKVRDIIRIFAGEDEQTAPYFNLARNGFAGLRPEDFGAGRRGVRHSCKKRQQGIGGSGKGRQCRFSAESRC